MCDKYLIWGAGGEGKGLYEFIKNMDYENKPCVLAFVDNNKEKQGKTIDDINIFSPIELEKLKFDYIHIAVSAYFDEIKLQIEELGFRSKIKNILGSYWDKITFNSCIPNNYKYRLSIVSVMKNFADGIEEWIEYYLLLGISHFYIYDNESTDNLKKRLEQYIKNGKITYHFYPGDVVQNYAYNHAICNYKNETEFMAFIDDDEFIVPKEDKLLPDVIDEIIKKNSMKPRMEKIGGIGINWRIYGTSFHKKKQKGMVIENYTLRADDFHQTGRVIKTICNPRVVKGFLFNPHACIYKKGYCCISENGDIVKNASSEFPSYNTLWINHYRSKSEEELIAKFERGWPDPECKNICEKFKEQMTLAKNDCNEIKDTIMNRYIEIIKFKIKFNNK